MQKKKSSVKPPRKPSVSKQAHLPFMERLGNIFAGKFRPPETLREPTSRWRNTDRLYMIVEDRVARELFSLYRDLQDEMYNVESLECDASSAELKKELLTNQRELCRRLDIQADCVFTLFVEQVAKHIRDDVSVEELAIREGWQLVRRDTSTERCYSEVHVLINRENGEVRTILSRNLLD